MHNNPSNRSFGIVFFIFFEIIFIYQIFVLDSVNFTFGIIGIIFLLLGILKSKILSPLNFFWTKFGNLLGKTVSPLVLALIYFLGVMFTKLLIIVLRKDILDLNLSIRQKSYWKNKDKGLNKSMDNQF